MMINIIILCLLVVTDIILLIIYFGSKINKKSVDNNVYFEPIAKEIQKNNNLVLKQLESLQQ